MKNLLFTLWMLLFPVTIEIARYIHYKTKMKPKEDRNIDIWIASIETLIWLVVGYLLYNN